MGGGASSPPQLPGLKKGELHCGTPFAPQRCLINVPGICSRNASSATTIWVEMPHLSKFYPEAAENLVQRYNNILEHLGGVGYLV